MIEDPQQLFSQFMTLAMSGNMRALLLMMAAAILPVVLARVRDAPVGRMATQLIQSVGLLPDDSDGDDGATYTVLSLEVSCIMEGGFSLKNSFPLPARAVVAQVVDAVKKDQAPPGYRLMAAPWNALTTLAFTNVRSSIIQVAVQDETPVYARLTTEREALSEKDKTSHVFYLNVDLRVPHGTRSPQGKVQTYLDSACRKRSVEEEEEAEKDPRCYVMTSGDQAHKTRDDEGCVSYDVVQKYPAFDPYPLDLSKTKDNTFFTDEDGLLPAVFGFQKRMQDRREATIRGTKGDFYSRTGMPPKFMAMLGGKPGTGKTSIARMLAKETGRNIKYVDPSMVLTQGTLREIINSDEYNNSRVLVLIEDIDRTHLAKFIKSYKHGGVDAVPEVGFTRADLLNALDGVLDPRGLMLIATTNMDTSEMDPAMARPGRLEPYHIAPMSLDDALRMHRIWFGEDAEVPAPLYESLVTHSEAGELTQANVGMLLTQRSSRFLRPPSAEDGDRRREKDAESLDPVRRPSTPPAVPGSARKRRYRKTRGRGGRGSE